MSNKLGRDREKEFVNKLRQKLCKDCQQEIKEWASSTCRKCKAGTLSQRIVKRMGVGITKA